MGTPVQSKQKNGHSIGTPANFSGGSAFAESSDSNTLLGKLSAISGVFLKDWEMEGDFGLNWDGMRERGGEAVG
jgi:hypothetical protein